MAALLLQLLKVEVRWPINDGGLPFFAVEIGPGCLREQWPIPCALKLGNWAVNSEETGENTGGQGGKY